MNELNNCIKCNGQAAMRSGRKRRHAIKEGTLVSIDSDTYRAYCTALGCDRKSRNCASVEKATSNWNKLNQIPQPRPAE